MLAKIFRFLEVSFIFVILLNGSIGVTQHYTNDEYIQNHNNDFKTLNTSNELSENSFSWIKSAQNMLASPSGRVAMQFAKELINRSTGSQVRSEAVLSLNVTNLLIILLLKVLIFAAGILGSHYYGGYGGYGGYGYARSIDDGASASDVSLGLTNGEDYLITAFLAAQGSGADDCLYAAACANPKISQKYAKAARALLEGIQKFERSPLNDPRYKDLVELIEKATYDGLRGSPCNITTTDCTNFI